jgi:hypothetical protein
MMENAVLAPLAAPDFQALRTLRRLSVIEARELSAYVPAARLFVKEALARAEALADQDAELSRELVTLARRASYNLGADTWPGWGDGQTVTAEEQRLGAAAAALCLELGEQLNEADDARAGALWLVGAHALATRSLPAARDAFAKAAALALEPEGKLLFEGYLALTGVVAGEDGSEQRLADIRERLAQVSDDPWSVKQLLTAEAAFAAPA